MSRTRTRQGVQWTWETPPPLDSESMVFDKAKRRFVIDGIRGVAIYESGRLESVNADLDTSHLKITNFHSEGPKFDIKDGRDTVFRMIGQGDGKRSSLSVRGFNKRALANSIRLLENVVKPFLTTEGVTEITGNTPNSALADILEIRCGAQRSEHEPMITEVMDYELSAKHGIYDPKYIGSAWFKVVIPIPPVNTYTGFKR